GGKNALGVDCLILGFFFVSYLLKVWHMVKGKPRRKELWLCGGLLFGLGWLLHMAQSSTALVSLMVGISMMLFMGLPMVKKENIGTWIVLVLVGLGIAEFVFGLSDAVFALLGRDKTLTDRVYVWRDCLSIPINPILGAGFESFWLGKRQEIMNAKWYWHPNEAHNGYLETYLTLGLLGLFILLALLFSTFWKCRRELIANFHLGRFRMGFLSALVVYNWTESSFKALHPMWFVFYIIALDYTKDAVVVPADPARIEVPPGTHGLEAGDEPGDSPPELAAFDR
ncbi:MAG: O-antigen ligase family protein, partial [Negativicutes bacterium]|nr:O-antigen ligase family protein [Negativicutes bacterium]